MNIVFIKYNSDFISKFEKDKLSFSCKGRSNANNSSVSVSVTNMCLYSLLNIK